MELIKRNLHRTEQKAQGIQQIALDEDMIVPDTKDDMESILVDGGEVELEEIRLTPGKVQVRGRLYFRVLYHTQKQKSVDHLEGSIPFEETIHVEQASPGDDVRIDWDMEELSTTMIHSRKLNIKALLTLTAVVETDCVKLVTVEGDTSQGAQVASRSVEVAQMAVQLRDTYRIKEEVELSGNKPNVSQILWYELEPRGIECRPLDGKLSIHGEMEMFCIYKGEEDHIPLQWVERSIPFSGAVEVTECTDEMIPDIRIRPIHRNVEAKEDCDGERRLLSLEAVIELDVRLYREESLEILEDVYCPGADVTVEMQTMTLERLVKRNASKYKMTEKLSFGQGNKVLQVCHVDGSVKIDRITSEAGGLQVEGTLRVDVLYVAADDNCPVRCLRGFLPFTHAVEVMDGSPKATKRSGDPDAAPTRQGTDTSWRYRIKPGLEQLGAMLLGNGEVEIKALITLDSLVLEPVTIENMDQVQIVPLDAAKFDQIPSMVGYVVQKGDTLWKVAKKFYASVDNIKTTNGLTTDELMPGQKLLILKETGGSLLS